MSSTFDADEKSAGTTRRLFLRGSAAVAGGTVMGAGASAAAETDNLPPNIPEWMKAPGEPMGSQPYGAPSPFEKGVVKNISKTLKQYISASGRTPLQELGWHHHAERTVLRAASRRRSDHRSGSAPVDAARAGRASADLHNG
ncbi:hypothetical protein ACVW0I_005792 [Bradyrhizobium sp. LM6.11]